MISMGYTGAFAFYHSFMPIAPPFVSSLSQFGCWCSSSANDAVLLVVRVFCLRDDHRYDRGTVHRRPPDHPGYHSARPSPRHRRRVLLVRPHPGVVWSAITHTHRGRCCVVRWKWWMVLLLLLIVVFVWRRRTKKERRESKSRRKRATREYDPHAASFCSSSSSSYCCGGGARDRGWSSVCFFPCGINCWLSGT